MKECTSCMVTKSESEFAFRSTIARTYHSSCKICTREQSRRYYTRNKRSHIDRAIRNNKVRQERFNDMKRTLWCVICGENERVCLDFHHRDPTQKDFEVGSFAAQVGWTTLLEEISKCTVLCANCHRKVHAGIIKLAA